MTSLDPTAFLIQAWWPALLAGVVSIGVTVAIERWGGTLGGLLGTLPTTIVPASLGLFATSLQPDAFVAAMCAVPPGMLLNALFLYLWRALPPHLPTAWSIRERLGAMILTSLLAWLTLAIAMVLLMGHLLTLQISPWPVGVATTAALIGFGAWACIGRPPSPKGSRKVSPLALLARGVLAGAAIAGAIALSMVGGDIAAGVASVFPAIFMTTMVSLWISQDRAVQAGAVGPMMLGASSVSVFALLAAALFPLLGLAAGCAVAWVAAVLTTTVPSWYVLSGRHTLKARRASTTSPTATSTPTDRPQHGDKPVHHDP